MLLAANHDSYFDPLAIGMAASRRRQIRALAKAALWDVRGLGPILNGMRQVPIERASGDAGALASAVEAPRGGACIGIFVEGTISVGRQMRAKSGLGRLAVEALEARLVCATVEGTRNFVRFPKRPRVKVRFFEPASGQTGPGESGAEISARLLAERSGLWRHRSTPVAIRRRRVPSGRQRPRPWRRSAASAPRPARTAAGR